MLIFIAPIIFAEGYGLKSRQFFANIWRILAHAFVGTFISTVIVAVMTFYLPSLTGLDESKRLTMPECLTFGSLISATDPVTTLAIFKDMKMVSPFGMSGTNNFAIPCFFTTPLKCQKGVLASLGLSGPLLS